MNPPFLPACLPAHLIFIPTHARCPSLSLSLAILIFPIFSLPPPFLSPPTLTTCISSLPSCFLPPSLSPPSLPSITLPSFLFPPSVSTPFQTSPSLSVPFPPCLFLLILSLSPFTPLFLLHIPLISFLLTPTLSLGPLPSSSFPPSALLLLILSLPLPSPSPLCLLPPFLLPVR